MKQINVSTLRRNVSGNWLRKEVTEPIEIVSGRKKEPVAIIMSFEHYMKVQKELKTIKDLTC